MTIYFKLVSIGANGDRTSWLIHQHPYQITYWPGRSIRAIPGTLGCMAFSTSDKCKEFIAPTPLLCAAVLELSGRSLEIWTCNLDGPWTPNWIFADHMWMTPTAEFDLFLSKMHPLTIADLAKRESLDWMKKALVGTRTYVVQPLPGTVCGTALKLLECIERF